jgi:colanic acid/amylovoran biosynthesis glycosyltransferase
MITSRIQFEEMRDNSDESLSPRKPTVAVYVEQLLAPTMTFVRAQASALQSFCPVYLSAQRAAQSLELPEDRVVTIRSSGTRSVLGKAKEIPLKVFGYDPLFFRRVRRFHPVLLHAHFGPAALTVLPLARWLRVPLIATFHGYDATVTDDFARKSVYRFRIYSKRRDVLKRGAEMFIAVSRFIRKKVLEQGFPEDRVSLHYIGIDTEFFKPDAAVRRDPIILYTASFGEQKGCEYLIRAMGEVQVQMPEAELVLIGDGPLRQGLERLAREKLRRYRFLGVQPPEVVRMWMNRSRVFSVPSVVTASGESEGFGMVFAEAQAMGLPVASFASGGIPEAVSHGETGLLAPERDWRALAGNIVLLLEDDVLWQRLSQAGRPRICSQFNLATQTRKLEGLYRLVLHGSIASKGQRRWENQNYA